MQKPDPQALALNAHRVRYESQVIHLPEPARKLIRQVLDIVGMDKLLAVTAGTGEPGILVIYSSMMFERLTVVLEEDTSGFRGVLSAAALLYGIGWTAVHRWPTMPEPVNEWQASRFLLDSLLREGKLDPEVETTARLVMSCMADAAVEADSPQAVYLSAVRHALFVPFPDR